MEHYPRIILVPWQRYLYPGWWNNLPKAEKKRDTSSLLRTQRATHSYSFLILFCGSIAFSIWVSTVFLLILVFGWYAWTRPLGSMRACILCPKMPDIMPLPNLNNIMPLFIRGRGRRCLVFPNSFLVIFASISVRQLELTVSNHAENAPPPSIHVTTASRGK